MSYSTSDIEIAGYLELKTGEISKLSKVGTRVNFSFGREGDKEKYQRLAKQYYEDEHNKFMSIYKNLRNRVRTFLY